MTRRRSKACRRSKASRRSKGKRPSSRPTRSWCSVRQRKFRARDSPSPLVGTSAVEVDAPRASTPPHTPLVGTSAVEGDAPDAPQKLPREIVTTEETAKQVLKETFGALPAVFQKFVIRKIEEVALDKTKDYYSKIFTMTTDKPFKRPEGDAISALQRHLRDRYTDRYTDLGDHIQLEIKDGHCFVEDFLFFSAMMGNLPVWHKEAGNVMEAIVAVFGKVRLMDAASKNGFPIQLYRWMIKTSKGETLNLFDSQTSYYARFGFRWEEDQDETVARLRDAINVEFPAHYAQLEEHGVDFFQPRRAGSDQVKAYNEAYNSLPPTRSDLSELLVTDPTPP